MMSAMMDSTHPILLMISRATLSSEEPLVSKYIII